MKIIKKNEYDYETSNSKWKEIIWYHNFQYLKEVKNDLEAIKTIIDTDYKDLSDDDFYNIMSRFYTFQITKKDILNILSKINSKEYNKVETLNSRMVFKCTVHEGHRKDLSWWEETFEVRWIVATSKDLTLDENYYYSKEEIEEMIKKKQIIAFTRSDKIASFDSKTSHQQEKLENINIPEINLDIKDYQCLLHNYDICFDFNLLKKEKTYMNNKIYKNAIKLIRKRLNKKRIINDCKEIILFLNDNIHLIDEFINKSIFSNKESYTELQKELTETYKILKLK